MSGDSQTFTKHDRAFKKIIKSVTFQPSFSFIENYKLVKEVLYRTVKNISIILPLVMIQCDNGIKINLVN